MKATPSSKTSTTFSKNSRRRRQRALSCDDTRTLISDRQLFQVGEDAKTLILDYLGKGVTQIGGVDIAG